MDNIAIVLVALLATAVDIAAFWALGAVEMGPGARIAVALLPLPGDAALLLMILARIRKLDEFQKRVQFEAVTIAFLSTGLAVFLYGCLQKAHVLGPLNAGWVWAFMVVFYGVGRAVAASRYR